MDNLRAKANELLESKAVDVVIGYEESPDGRVRPAFIKKPAEADKLIFDERCNNNLALYLSKHETRLLGKIAIVASIEVMKSLIILTLECQITEDFVKVIGVRYDGTMIDFADFKEMEAYINENPVDYKQKDKELLDKLDAMTVDQRWDFWQNELKNCFKCYACRAACPMCYCTRCSVEVNQPQWIPVASHEQGNLEWHILRAMHLSGRCVACGQCADACPLDLPINILTLKLNEENIKNFGFRAGYSMKNISTHSTFNPADKESFIL